MITIEGNRLYNFFNVFSKVYTETRLNISPDSIWYRHVDRSNVAMVDVHLYPRDCHIYSEDDTFEVGIDLKDAVSFLKSHKKDLITMIVGTENIIFECNGLKYMVNTSDPTKIRSTPNVPNYGPNDSIERGSFTVKCKDFKSIIKDMGFKGTTRMSFYTDDKGKVSIGHEFGSVMSTPYVCTKPDIEVKFSSDYVRDIISQIEPNTLLEIHIRTDCPMYIIANIGCEVMLVLAPRIES